MPRPTPDDRAKTGEELIERMMGAETAELVRAGWKSISPDFERFVVEFLAGDVWSRPGLDLKTRSLVTVAALASMGRWRGLELNLRMALNNGATRDEIEETLLQIAPYAGFPACWEGLVLLEKVDRGAPADAEST